MSQSRRLPPDFSRSAAYPLFAFDPVQDRAWVLHFAAEDYRRASFLDQRAVQHREIAGWAVSRAELDAARAPAVPGERLHWLFHIGHCGSSLVSKLLDLIPGVLGLREPLPLLALAHGREDAATWAWRDPVVALLARGFPDTRAVVVKPTSLVTTVAEQLLPGTGRACLLWVDLQTWLATMLRDDGLTSGVLDSEPLRLAGMADDGDPTATSSGERLARAWLTEQRRWHRLNADPDRAAHLLDLNFADVLAQPLAQCTRLAQHYGIEVPSDYPQRIFDSRLLTRYAKDGAQHFDADVRHRELSAAAKRHSDEIARGLAWAEAAIANPAGVPAQRLRPQPT